METWRAVDGLPVDWIEASDAGRVRSVPHQTWRAPNTHAKVGHWRSIKGRVLKPTFDKYGRGFVATPTEGSDQRMIGVAVLVCMAFHGEAPEGKPWALHRDDIKTNNAPANLYWGSRQENYADARLNKRWFVRWAK